MVFKLGNYICHYLHLDGCEYAYRVNALGYGAIVIPIAVIFVLVMNRIRD